MLAQRIRRSTGVRLHDIGPLRVARREPLLELGQLDRRSGYPLETVLLAARAGWRIVESDIDYRAQVRTVEGDRDGPRHRAGHPRHVRGAGPMIRTLVVIAKQPVPGG